MPFYGTVLGKQKITLCFASYPSRVGNWGAPQFALPIARRSWQTVCQNIPWPGGVLLKSMIISTVLSLLSSRLLRLHQLLNLLSVSRFVTVLNEANQCGVVCKLQGLDRGVSRVAVIRVQGEEQWGENTFLRSSSADRTGAGCVFSQPH